MLTARFATVLSDSGLILFPTILAFTLQLSAQKFTPAVRATLLLSTSTLITLLISRFLGLGTLTVSLLIGMIIIVIAVIISITNQTDHSPALRARK